MHAHASYRPPLQCRNILQSFSIGLTDVSFHLTDVSIYLTEVPLQLMRFAVQLTEALLYKFGVNLKQNLKAKNKYKYINI